MNNMRRFLAPFTNLSYFCNMKKKLLMAFLTLTLLFSGCGREGRFLPDDDTEQTVKTLLDSSVYHIDRHDLPAALLSLKKAEKLLPAVSNAKLGYQVCQYLGWINETGGAGELALHYQQRALAYAEEYGKPEYVVDVLINQANTLFNLNLNDSAWRVNLRAARFFDQVDKGQQSVILKNVAWYEMLHDSLPEAERHAYRAAMAAQDSSALGNALSLLGQIYIRQGRYEQAQMLIGVMPAGDDATFRYNRLLIQSGILERQGHYEEALHTEQTLRALADSLHAASRDLEIVKIQTRYDQEVSERTHAEQRLGLTAAIAALLILMLILTVAYQRRTRTLFHDYQDRIARMKSETAEALRANNTTIEQLKQQADTQLAEIEALKRRLPTQLHAEALYESVAETKLGIDVIYAILHDDNISQYGKKEQRAMTEVMRSIDRELAFILENPDYALTPKEAFFCLMERNGKTDADKARAFCCSEQALRSTKSRLGKKLDLQMLHV